MGARAPRGLWFPVNDPREELARLIEAAEYGDPSGPVGTDYDAADAVLAALPSLGWVNLARLASDPDVIEKVAKARYEREEWVRINNAAWSDARESTREISRRQARAWLGHVAAALIATPENNGGESS